MGLPTTTTGPTNVYILLDDSGVTAGPTASGPTGAESQQQLSPEFTATSLTNATTIAHIFSSAFQRPVRLVQKYGGSPPWTLVTGVAPTIALTSVPSGTGY